MSCASVPSAAPRLALVTLGDVSSSVDVDLVDLVRLALPSWPPM